MSWLSALISEAHVRVASCCESEKRDVIGCLMVGSRSASWNRSHELFHKNKITKLHATLYLSVQYVSCL